MRSQIFRKILVLAANPRGTSQIRLDQEVRDIAEGLRRSSQRDQFELEQRWAVRSRDIQRAMLDSKPQIVHFSGHGIVDEGLVLEDESGQPKVVEATALANLFELFSHQVECVLLNACYSLPQAEAISQHVPYVIGTSQSISDEASIEFAVGFYDALAAGESVEFAHRAGCISIQLAGIDEGIAPILLKKDTQQELNKSRLTFVVSGDIDEVTKEKITAIVKQLRTISGDASLELKSVTSGSIILELEGYEEGYKILETLYKEGKLTEVLGLRIKKVEYGTASRKNNDSAVEVFFSYSHKDEDLRNEVAVHLSILERNGVIAGWYDRQIEAGEEWAERIDDRMNSASIIMLLVSSDFIASDYCWNIEVKRAMERHNAGDACVIPVLLRPVNWKKAPFGKLQALPKDARPVTSWTNRDEALTDISQGIEAIAGRFVVKNG